MLFLATLAFLIAIGDDGTPNRPVRRSCQNALHGSKRKSKLASGFCFERIRKEWSSGIQFTVLGLNGAVKNNTGEANETLCHKSGRTMSFWFLVSSMNR